MGNKIRAGIVGAAIVAGTVLTPAVAANAAPVQGKIAAVQLHKGWCGKSPADFLLWFGYGLFGSRWC